MRNKAFIGLLVLLVGGLLSACSANDKGPETKPKEKSEQVENQNETPTDAEDDPEPVKWYEGEEATDLEKLQLLSAFQSGERSFDFYAVFTEPFWAFYFFDNEVLFSAADFDIPEVHALEYPFTDDEEEQALSFMRNGEFWQLKVKKESGSDGMSDITYDYSVKLELMEGGGSTSIMKGEQ